MQTDFISSSWTLQEKAFLNTTNKHITFAKDIQKTGSKLYKSIQYDEKFINKTLKNNFFLYEVIRFDIPRKFYIDIDIANDKLNFNKYKNEELIESCNVIVNHSLYLIDPDITFDINAIRVLYVKKSDKKQSLHIIYPIYFKNNDTLIQFRDIIKYSLKLKSNDLKEHQNRLISKDTNTIHIDLSVYTKNRCFRLPYQSKYEKEDYTLIPFATKKYKKASEYLVGVYNDHTDFIDEEKLKLKFNKLTMVQIIKDFPNAKNDKIDTQKIIEYYPNVITSLIQDISTPNFNLTEEVEFLISCIPNSSKNSQSYTTWYSIGQALKNISIENPAIDGLSIWIKWSLKAIDKYPDDKDSCTRVWNKLTFRTGEKKYRVKFIKSIAQLYNSYGILQFEANNLSKDLLNLNMSGFDEVSIYNCSPKKLDTLNGFCKPIDFDNYDIEILYANLGLGKSFQIKQMLKKHKFKRVLLISSRKTFSKEKTAELKSIYPNFYDYTDETVSDSWDWLQFKQLAIQVESLKHLSDIDYCTKYDCVILDEIESILYQFSSSTNKQNSLINFNTFMCILSYQPKIIMADAFITNRTLEFTRNLKQLFDFKVKLSHNRYSSLNRTANIIGNAKNVSEISTIKIDFINHIISSLENNKIICVCVASRSFKQRIIQKIYDRFGEEFKKHIKEYDSYTNDDSMNDLKNVNYNWTENVKLLIYTSKISIGINYDVKGIYDTIYIYGSVCCPIVRDIIQSHYRVRHINSKNIYIALYSGIIPDYNDDEIDLVYVENMNKQIDNRFESNYQWTSKFFRNIYENIINYNSLEEKIGKLSYDKLFTHFMKLIGYDIKNIINNEHIQNNNNNEEENWFDISYDEYNRYKLLKKCDGKNPNECIEKYEYLQLKGRATRSDKMILSVYYFRTTIFKFKESIEENIIKLLRLSKDKTEVVAFFDKAPDNEIQEYFEYELFNYYFNNRQIRNYMNNMMEEFKTYDLEQAFYLNNYSVKEQKKHILQLEFIKNMCIILGLKNSFDLETVISEETFAKFTAYLKEPNNSLFKECFDIQIRSKNDVLIAKQVVNSCINQWNGMNFSRIVKERLRKYGEKEIRKYVYVIKKNDDMFKNVYAALISSKV
jgi:hypothetical protein